MFLHKYQADSSLLYTLFDSDGRVVTIPTSYLRHLRLNRRPAESQRQIAYVITQYCQYLEENYKGILVDEILRAVTSDDTLGWINDQRDKGISEVTIHNREVLIRGSFNWFTTAGSGHFRDNIPWDNRMFSRNSHKKIPRFVTMEQVITLLNGLHNES